MKITKKAFRISRKQMHALKGEITINRDNIFKIAEFYRVV